ncbi:Deoxycytidine monophosphate (dCMP) deaminase [Yamadazyma tenuis]|uniref:Deoxycytidylate deaminase n=1 Tax=Candida tenuis (strain ATCC 10573 / BCRC 21748 / CBS 615 / JCM 9827 / NBRC 10315 / NRRL Y-1498 / VKM Y-70) TaxID=590646 RepID=G3B7N3_CANTC|nr:uncharacterized protein CANTEDRAFT_115117 [Yamadazyma tenuis ATCC 10573]EGV61655.1 hypothetical protein CANTEDRAFT_115117 [Yamadazyma tenuis ATCC 10573]WEJ92884.1 Deoxycytidine monophosphate (dCMP) deaminase [Yamadazyma tenuis]
MLIGISGTTSSGKTEIARYLTFQGFTHISIMDYIASKSPETSSNDVYTSSMEAHQFPTLDALVDHVTANWRTNFVLRDITSLHVLHALQKRPFFLHIAVDAPIKLRYQRYKSKHNSKVTLEEFVDAGDTASFAAGNPLAEINGLADINIINTSSSIKDLFIKLSELNLFDQSRLRPTWDAYFMRLADLAALRSNCMKRRVGCVLVRGNRVIATGYNGTPRHLTNCNEGGCERCNKGQGSGAGLSTCLCLHAEENALLESGRDRINEGSVLYCNTCPCLTCAIKIVQSGITEVVYAQSYSMDSATERVMGEARIVLRQYEPPRDGVII